MTLMRCFRLTVLLLVLGGTVGCDQTTKHLARKTLDSFDTITLMGGLGELRLAENPGAFLSLGASLPQPIRQWVFTAGTGLGLLALLVYLLVRPPLLWLIFSGLTFILAGGAGNLIDRLIHDGQVTDFLVLRCGSWHTGVFNIADMAVLFGVLLLLVAYVKPRGTPAPLHETIPPEA